MTCPELEQAGSIFCCVFANTRYCSGKRFETTGKLQPWTFKRTALDALPAEMICNNMEALMRAAVQGLGLAFMPDFIGREAVTASSLRGCAGRSDGPAAGLLVALAARLPATAKLRAFIDFFAPRLATK